MKTDEKQLLINRQVEKAHYMLSQAEEMMSLGHTDLAVNRYYYACFHIVQSLFLKKGISVRSHSGMISQFSQYFVKTGVVSLEDGSFLARLFQLRQKADYNCAYDITSEDAASFRDPARRFVDKITKLVKD